MLIRAGVIGPGGIGSLHVAALRAIGVEVTGVAAISPEVARRSAARLGVPTAHGSADSLISTADVDVVHVCTPNGMHFAQCYDALVAGKHVVAEKPLATSAVDAADLLARAKAANVVHAVCHAYRHHEAVQTLRELVAGGGLGQIHTIHGTYLLDELIAVGSGHWMLDPVQMGPSLSLADVGVHWWDLVEHVTGTVVAAAFCEARTTRPGASTGEDSAALLLRLDDGAVATGTVCQTAPGHGNTITIEAIGSRGVAEWDSRRADRLRVGDAGRCWRVLDFPSPPTRIAAFRSLFERVYAHVRFGRPAAGPYPTFADGVHGLRVLEALLESARRGRWVDV